jgi:hypothetical protein
MNVCAGQDRLGRVMFWMAMMTAPFTYSGNARTQHFAIGFAAGLFLTCLLGMLLRRTASRR